MSISDIFKKIFGNSVTQFQVGGNNISQVQIGGDKVSQIQVNSKGNNISQVQFGGNGSSNVQISDNGNSVIIVNGQIISGNGVAYTGTGRKHKKVAIDSEAKTFSKIQVSGPFNIIYMKSDDYGVNVDASAEMLEKITVYVRGDILCIEPYEPFINKSGKINITVKAPIIKSVSLSGAAGFKVDSSIVSPDDMNIRLSGAGDIDLNRVICKNIVISLTGAGDVYAAAIEAKNEVALNITGAGDIDINKIKAFELIAKVVGAGDITVSHANVNKISKSNIGAGTISIN